MFQCPLGRKEFRIVIIDIDSTPSAFLMESLRSQGLHLLVVAVSQLLTCHFKNRIPPCFGFIFSPWGSEHSLLEVIEGMHCFVALDVYCLRSSSDTSVSKQRKQSFSCFTVNRVPDFKPPWSFLWHSLIIECLFA